MTRPKKNGTKAVILSAKEAVKYIKDGSTVGFSGAGGGLLEATEVIDALAYRFDCENAPKKLTYYHATGLGDRGERGMSPLAKPGMVKKIFGGHWGQSPRLAEMAERNEIEAYNFPQGVMAQLLRCSAAGQPGLLTKTGIGTFADPRNQGCKLNEITKENLVDIMNIKGEEYLFYPSIPIDVAIIRGSTADTLGYISMEDEIAYLDSLALAQAVHNNGGLVICQVKRIVKERSINPKQVKIPGYLVDIVVEVPTQELLYGLSSDGFMSGYYQMEEIEPTILELNERKVIARRALLEMNSGNVGNVGVGIADGIGIVASEEGVSDQFTLTVETGPIGGSTAQGIFFGASVNSQALLDMPSQFDFYDGGGLDVCFLSFAEIDSSGNVNVHKFGGRIMGTGGFINICQNTKKAVFCGTLTAGGLKLSTENGTMNVIQEGRFKKFVNSVEEITFSASEALKQCREVIYITERAVFRLTPQGLELSEIAEGIDIENDIISNMEFRPLIADNLKIMDPRLFEKSKMNIKEEFMLK